MTQPQKDLSNEYWKTKLSDDVYHVTREKGTEPAFSGLYVNNHLDGTYRCVACNEPLFSSDTKFDSHSGWPSFTNPINLAHVELHQDSSLDMVRTEISCANCGAHLGHVFDDGPEDKGGARYCVNSLSLSFEPTSPGIKK